MKVVLVYPALEWEKKVFKQTIPLGIAYIASVLESKNIEVQIIDNRFLNGTPLEEYIPTDADVVGFSSFTFQFQFALKVCEKLRKKGCRSQLVFGGPHASALPQDVIKLEEIDAVFVGEAEESFPLYLDYLNGKIDANNLIRTYVSTPSGTIRGEKNHWIKRLDDLPFPARHLFPISKIMEGDSRHVNIVSTRGCPYNCTFCQPMKRTLFGPKIRRRSVKNILVELKECVKKYKITNFGFVDDTFTFDKKYLIEFCSSLVNSGIKLDWSCQTRSDLDFSVLELMKKSGCSSFWIGIESGSQTVLDNMNKQTSVDKNREFLKNCQTLGITTLVNMMVGYPGETERDLKKSVDFINETNPTQVIVSQVTPFPGTYIFNNKDVISQNFNHVARHIFTPKFKSMTHMQKKIRDAATSMSKVMGEFSISSVKEEDIEKCLSGLSCKNKQVYVFGTSVIGKKVHTILTKKGLKISGFIDNYFKGTIENVPVKKPFKPKDDYCIILASLTYSIVMRKQLEALGVTPEKIIEFY